MVSEAREGEAVDIRAFLARLWSAPWVFKIILSPAAERSVNLPLQEYAQAWMQAVERDLHCRVDWVGGAHFDTDTPHVQFLVSGRTRGGQTVQLDRGYISHGVRARASEILSLYKGS
jgi:type IV secretory pathway VirD2 relaxase